MRRRTANLTTASWSTPGSGEKRLEGFLYPETYFIPDGMSAHDIVDLMLEQIRFCLYR